MKQFFTFLLFSQILIYSSCSAGVSENERQTDAALVSVGCWNAQTFFDAEIDGTEYSDYQNLAKWSKDKYLRRISRLCEVMTSLDADIFVLEELENVAVVQDIANQLAGNAWGKTRNWNYGAFVKESGAAIGCGVFSRYQLENLRIHSLAVETQSAEQPSLRPILQVSVQVGGKELFVFVNHWKSKSSGEMASEIWRDWQESLLAKAVKKIEADNGEIACILCGDFNRDADEFVCDFNGSGKQENVLLRCVGEEGTGLKVYSPWFTESGGYSSETGSYYYDGNWERIDNIFAFGAVRISAFSPRIDGPWAGSGGVPNGFKIYSGEGYSDHLPLLCTVSLL